MAKSNKQINAGVSKLLELAAGDTVTIQAGNSISVGGLTGDIYTNFSGFLVSVN